MALTGGYWGKILWVDLTTGKTSIRTFDEAFARKYLGGVGLAARIISDNVTRHVNPLGPGNVLVFATGPYQAARIAGAGKITAAARSPLTGYWGESNCGANVGPALKKAGFDAVAIIGRAKKPVYLWINNGEVQIRDAGNLWGADTVKTVDALREQVEVPRASVVTIGPAGENLVRYACIASDNNALFGRCGLGAVMGSKNLKALAMHGTLQPPIADPERLEEVYKTVRAQIMAAPFTQSLREHGTARSIVAREANGLLPMKNWSQDRWPEGAERIGVPRFTEELGAVPWPCQYCVMGCHRRITNPEYESATGGPQYETLGMIGSNLLIDDLKAIVRANDLCNRYGIDTIEFGAMLAWAFECTERGLLAEEDADGVELTWGNGEALVKMTEKIANRDGLGNLLAEGLRACVDRIPESKPFAVEAMGQAAAAHNPRAFFAQVITTIASTRGSCHLHGFAEAVEVGALLPELGIDEPLHRFDWEKKGYVGAMYQDVQQVWNSLVWCFFYFLSNVSLADQVNILNGITGWDVTPHEAQKIGERIVCMQHCFNLRMGLVPEQENVMPERLATPHQEGGAAGRVPPWQTILQEYWETKDWVNGVPTRSKLVELGLQDFAKELHGT